MSNQPHREREHLRRGLDAIPPLERSLDGDRLRETRAFRGLDLKQAIRYLDGLGGERTEENVVEGDAWRADLSAREVAVGPTYRLNEVIITWTGDASVLEAIIYRFRLKTFRAPG